jgi:hypothetical protein
MPEERIDAGPEASATPEGGPGEPAEQLQGEKPTNRHQRLKAQRDRAWQEIADLKGEMASLKEVVSQALPHITRGAEPEQPTANTPNRFDTLPLDQYEEIITNEELWAEKPRVPAYALATYAKRLTENVKDKLRQEITQEVLGGVQVKDDNQKVLGRIMQDFGENALDQDEQLFQVANQKYIALQRKYGEEKVNEMPELKYQVMLEAANELGFNRSPQAAINQGAPTPSPAGPPPEERLEGASEGIADAMGSKAAHLSKGDWKSAFKDIAKRAYPGM